MIDTIMLILSIFNIVAFITAAIVQYKAYGWVAIIGWLAAIGWVINYMLAKGFI